MSSINLKDYKYLNALLEISPKADWDKIFENGSNTQEYREDISGKYINDRENKAKELIQFMKSDINKKWKI